MLILESNSCIAMQFLSPGSGTQQQEIMFGDAACVTAGSIIYDHGDNQMRIGTGGAGRAIFSTNGLLYKSGCTATPAFSFICDTDLGMYRAGANILAFSGNCNETLRVDAHNKKLYMNDCANGNSSQGMTLNQGGADDEILALKSSDVSHPITAGAEADTYGTFGKAEATSGGLAVKGWKDADGSPGYALVLTGYIGEPASTTDTCATPGVVQICGRQTDDGTGAKAIDAAGAVFVVSTQGTTRFILKGNGDLHATDTSITALDNYCDVGLVRTMSTMNTAEGVIKSRWDDHVHENICSLIDAGLYSVPPWDGGLLNISQLWRLHNGAIWQLWTTIKDQGEELLGLRQQLNALQGGCP